MVKGIKWLLAVLLLGGSTAFAQQTGGSINWTNAPTPKNNSNAGNNALVFTPAPLGIVDNFPSNWNGTGAATNFLVKDHTSYWGVITVKTWMSVGHILYYIPTTADNTSNLYDLALMTFPTAATGGTVTRVLHIGPIAGTVFAPATGLRDQPVQGGPVLVAPGSYLFAATTNCASSCAVLGSAGSITTDNYLTINTSGPASTGGTVPASFSVGAWTISSANGMPGFALEP